MERRQRKLTVSELSIRGAVSVFRADLLALFQALERRASVHVAPGDPVILALKVQYRSTWAEPPSSREWLEFGATLQPTHVSATDQTHPHISARGGTRLGNLCQR